jgi:hypothetical protein
MPWPRLQLWLCLWLHLGLWLHPVLNKIKRIPASLVLWRLILFFVGIGCSYGINKSREITVMSFVELQVKSFCPLDNGFYENSAGSFSVSRLPTFKRTGLSLQQGAAQSGGTRRKGETPILFIPLASELSGSRLA